MIESIARTQSGEIRGQQKSGLHEFLGVRYAEAPTGEQRWLPPIPPAPWSGARDAVTVGAASHQDPVDTMADSGTAQVEEIQDEDCLFLNLWTPGLSGARPVMVWIHGGAFAIGSGSQWLYNGRELCRRDVVLVSINYRLGPFGFLHLDGPTDRAIPATGNEGLLDQVAALQWVRNNIAAFGGDPNNVTIFGESAGSMSVMALLSMPAAKGLFHKAIAQSGASHNLLVKEEAQEWVAEPFLQALGIDVNDEDALRDATPEQVMAAWPGFFSTVSSGDPEQIRRWTRPVIDGLVLPSLPEQALAEGSARGIPLLAGTTRDETLVIAPNLTDNMLLAAVQNGLPTLTQSKCISLIEAHRSSRTSRGARIDPSSLLSAIVSNTTMRIPTTRVLDVQRQYAPVYHYIFDWISPGADGALGAPHGVDVGFVFGTTSMRPKEAAATVGRGPAVDALSNAVMDAWAAFARSGNPSAEGLGDWPAYDAAQRPTMMIGANVHVAEAPYETERRAFDGIDTAAMRSMQEHAQAAFDNSLK
jgi:para-nitrobenzyl esterase